jgi:hypothetical protein
MWSPSCQCVCVSPTINCRMEPIFMKLGMYIMTPESSSTAYFINETEPISLSYFTNPSHQSVWLSLLPFLDKGSIKFISRFMARQRLSKHVPAAKNTRISRRIVGRIISCAARVLSKKSLWACLCILVSFLGNNSVKTFLRQRSIFGDVVLYAVPLTLKENRRLVLPRSSC